MGMASTSPDQRACCCPSGAYPQEGGGSLGLPTGNPSHTNRAQTVTVRGESLTKYRMEKRFGLRSVSWRVNVRCREARARN